MLQWGCASAMDYLPDRRFPRKAVQLERHVVVTTAKEHCPGNGVGIEPLALVPVCAWHGRLKSRRVGPGAANCGQRLLGNKHRPFELVTGVQRGIRERAFVCFDLDNLKIVIPYQDVKGREKEDGAKYETSQKQ